MAKKRKMLSDWQADYIQSLMRVIETQSKATLANWAVEYSSSEILPLWVKHYPEDSRPQLALEGAKRWLAGEVKLPEAKKLILQCHQAARDTVENPVAQAAARAIGQSASTIHSARHCIGLAFYGALALAYDTCGTEAPWDKIERQAAKECALMEAALRDMAVENEPSPAKIDWKC